MEDEAKNKRDYFILVSILLSAVIIASAWIYTTGLKTKGLSSGSLTDFEADLAASLESVVFGKKSAELPVRWNDLGKRLIEAGVIDAEKFEAIYSTRDGLDDYSKKLLYGEDNGKLVINGASSGAILNLLWAFGLANKNPILLNGPMMDQQYGGAGGFASTGGWTIAKGSAMEHYSNHEFVKLTKEEQEKVERVSQNIYRPCCGNSTYFPDCNHGMAMLGLLELMASEGVSEEDMYKYALQVNSYWFPDTYLNIAKYLDMKGITWDKADPKELLGASYSSAEGSQRILREIQPVERQSGGGCGI